MKVTVDRTVLADALAWVTAGQAVNPASPILVGIKITANEPIPFAESPDTITIESFDYETARRATIPAEVVAAGIVLVPGKITAAIVAGGTGSTVEVLLDGSRLSLRMGRSNYSVGTMLLEDYPTLPPLPDPVGTIDAGVLREAVADVAYAVSNDPKANANLQGIHFVSDGASLVLEATERHMISRVDLAIDLGEFDVVPHGRTVVDALKGMAGLVTICTDGRSVALATDERTVITRAYEGEYPNLGRAFRPADTDAVTVECDGAELAAACKRLGVISDEKMPIRVTVTADALLINLPGEHVGDEVVDCRATGDMSFAVNAAYLRDSLPDGPVTLGLESPTRPINVYDPERDDLARCLMPQRIPGEG